MQTFLDRVAVVTGAGSGIGRSSAIAFAGQGMRVALLDLEQGPVDAAVAEIRANGGEAIGLVTDVSDEAAVQAAADRIEAEFGAIHLLMNNAAVFIRGPRIADVQDDVWRWLLNVNLHGALNGIRTFLPRIRAHGQGGHIVNTASISGLVVRDRRNGVYAASKAALISLSEALAYDLEGSGIGVSVAVPAAVSSEFYVTSAKLRGDLGGPNEFAKTPPDTLAGMTPDEVARRIVAGVAAGQFYIATHTRSRAHVLERHQAIMDAYDASEAWEQANGLPAS